VVATHVECGLTAEFGVDWVPRRDGKGNEIAGIGQEQMDAYSTRTQAITDRMPHAVASWTARYGRTPNRRELLHIRQAVTMATRAGKDEGVYLYPVTVDLGNDGMAPQVVFGARLVSAAHSADCI
jgi:hypothetical protein